MRMCQIRGDPFSMPSFSSSGVRGTGMRLGTREWCSQGSRIPGSTHSRSYSCFKKTRSFRCGLLHCYTHCYSHWYPQDCHPILRAHQATLCCPSRAYRSRVRSFQAFSRISCFPPVESDGTTGSSWNDHPHPGSGCCSIIECSSRPWHSSSRWSSCPSTGLGSSWFTQCPTPF